MVAADHWYQRREQVRHVPPPSCLYRVTCRRPKAGTSIDVPLATLLRDRPTASVDDQRSLSNSFLFCLLFCLSVRPHLSLCLSFFVTHTHTNTHTPTRTHTQTVHHLCVRCSIPILLLLLLLLTSFSSSSTRLKSPLLSSIVIRWNPLRSYVEALFTVSVVRATSRVGESF